MDNRENITTGDEMYFTSKGDFSEIPRKLECTKVPKKKHQSTFALLCLRHLEFSRAIAVD